MESVRLATERWPGVASAMELYYNLIAACMKIFDKDGDVPISAGSPSDTASVVSGNIVDGINRSRTTSPATASTASVSTPSDKVPAPFGYLQNQNQPMFNVNSAQNNATSSFAVSPNAQPATVHASPNPPLQQQFTEMSPKTSVDAGVPIFSFPPTTQFTSLPTTFAELPHWNPTFTMPSSETYGIPTMPMSSPFYNEAYAANQGYQVADYLNPGWSHEPRDNGLNQQQQVQLMRDFEMHETSKIEEMIHQSNQLFRPPQLHTY